MTDETTRTPINLLLDIKQEIGIMQTQHANIMAEQDEARVSRRLMHEKQDSMNATLQQVQSTVTSMEPTVLEHEQLRQRINGGVAVLVGLGSLVLIAAGFVLKEVWAWFTAHINWR
jgi:hypothetical protein